MLSQQASEVDSPSRRPMRKGTHSCLECRQRKIRCVSEPHARKCSSCFRKALHCTEQELRRSRSPNHSERKITRNRAYEHETKLEELLRSNSRINNDIRPQDLDKRVESFSTLTIAKPASTDVGNKTSRKGNKVNVLASSDADADAFVPNIRDSGDRPFLQLFEDLDQDKGHGRNSSSNVRADLSIADDPALRILRAFRLHIPNARELMSILQAGSSTMVLWRKAFPQALGGPDSISPERLRDYVYTCLYSENIGDVATLMLCLALHIQQLPCNLESIQISLSASLNDLQAYYMTSADTLLSSDERLAGTLRGLECMILQSEYCINAGSLRKVWSIVRRAIGLAQSLGLHHKPHTDVESGLATRRNAIWTELWQRERGISLILGLPYSALDSQTPPLDLDNSTSGLHRMKRFMRDLSIVMGHIIDRDQAPDGKVYSLTLKIDEQLDECQSIMSADWWDFTPGSVTPTDAICSTLKAKLRFYTVRRLLHLPFLLKAPGDRRYEGSRVSTLESSREIIKIYNVLRDEKKPVLQMCDMADFQVFTAAMTLIIDLLMRSGKSDACDLQREECDWSLILQTAMELKRVSRSMRRCDVAALGARVLDDFSNIRNGSVEGVSKVNIPFFGRVEIRRSSTRYDKHASNTQSCAHADNQSQKQDNPASSLDGSIETMVSLDSYLFPSAVTSQPWQGPDESWTNTLDLGLADDWNWFPCGDPS